MLPYIGCRRVAQGLEHHLDMVGVGGSIPLVPTSLKKHCLWVLFLCRMIRSRGQVMPEIILPDGSKKQFENAVSVMDVAESIGPGLAKATLAGVVDDQLVDTFFSIESDAKLTLITSKDQMGLDILRHSCAHLLAQAVKQLFPSVQVTIGPVIEDGFYYDFSFERPFTPEDLTAIEKRMHEIAKENLAVSRKILSRNAVIDYFKGLGEQFKVEIVEDLPEDEVLSLYTQGDFTDLCRGPHVPNTGCIKVFKLTKVSGAYWRGDSNNEMLQRIYGTAWADKKDLKAYLKRLEEAEKRDHRKLAKQLDLYHMQEEAPGMVFWHEAGWALWQEIETYIRDMTQQGGYQEIKTPQLIDVSLWEKSGHKAKFSNEMFLTSTENREFAIKPMSCPGHIQVFNKGLRSYRDLPIRFAEFGSCHRSEPSGALHGLMRVRGFVQDDGHIFCSEAQIQQEVAGFMDQAYKLYADFGFTDLDIKVATRPDNRIGSDEVWDKAEKALAEALKSKNIDFNYLPGEGAFYGPKVEIHLRDCLGRAWQCGTIQVDFSMPERLGATYIAEDNAKKVPVMIHRAIIGSMERFIGILIEHYAGFFPVWLAPTQVVVMGISDKHRDYAKKVTKDLKKSALRAKIDLRNEKIGYKIRGHTLNKVPYQLIVGDKEVADNLVSVRTCKGQDLGQMSIDNFISLINEKIEHRELSDNIIEGGVSN